MPETRKKKPKRRPRSKKTQYLTSYGVPKGISLNTPGFPSGVEPKEPNQAPSQELGLSLNDAPKAPKTFQTRKAEAMLKKGLNVKGNPLGKKLNSLGSKDISLANLVKRRKEQALKNDQKNHQKNHKNGPTKKAIKGRITDRKRNALAKVLEKVNQDKEGAKVRRELAKLTAQNSPKTILAKEKKEEWNIAAKQQQEEEDFENLYENRHGEQAIKMEGMEPELANELFKATTRAQESNREAMKREERMWMGPRSQKGPKSNTNLPDFRGELDETIPMRRIATNNVTKKRTK